ncbi:MAG: phosphotransferase [Armatimonadetes bacterium]|nr:phosphotransferase [Armatimonadota bacterium]
MLQSLTSFGLAFLLGIVLSRTLRRSLGWLYSRERKPGKEKIHRLFPKPKRPLGGGLAMMVAATVAVVAVPIGFGNAPATGAILALAIAWAYAGIGLVDDLQKAGGRGLNDRAKLGLQLVLALAFGALLWRFYGSEVFIPFVSGAVDFGVWYVFLAALVLVAAGNAVNLSDGIDGLAAGSFAIACIGIAALSHFQAEPAVAPICWPFVGAAVGFLVFNFPPARLLMGDTGALALGGAFGALGIMAHAEFMLLLLGAPFVLNVTSVLVQMGTVRGLWRFVKPLRHSRTETARPFLCTPLHHHFQWLAWNDKQILALYWGYGAVMVAWSLLATRSSLLWLAGLLTIPVFLLGAALQKLLRANFFLGLHEQEEGPAVVALYRGLPVRVLGKPLYRVVKKTSVSENMLVGATAESMLWRPISEVEAHIVLGKIYADQRLLDEALEEWEQVPTRNLLLRPNVVLRLARVYYGRDRLLEAIRLWEQIPASRMAEMPNLREVIRSAKMRLADLASKSHRQGLRALANTAERDAAHRAETYLGTARRYNQELLSLLLYEEDKLRGRAADPQAAHARRQLLQHTRDVVLGRLRELDEGLALLARTSPEPSASESAPGSPRERAANELGLSPEEVTRLVTPAGSGAPQVVGVAVHPKASRNTVYRLGLTWPDDGPSSVIVKLYAADRISFFDSCYRREDGILRLLRGYGAAVPAVYGGELREDRALLVLQDLGDETLAERLEAADAGLKRQWIRSAVSTLVALHSTALEHLRELSAEVQKVNKDRLVPDYYGNALRIAVERIAATSDVPITDSAWLEIAEQAGPLIDYFSERQSGFIHFEFTPHHLIVAEAGLYVFDFEQATMGPPEFDLAALLAQPETDVDRQVWDEMVDHYAVLGTEAGLPMQTRDDFARGVAYAAVFKCLVYAGAAAHFLGKFGGEHHLQRLTYYLNRCEMLMKHWHPLRPLGSLLAPHFQSAQQVFPRRSVSTSGEPSG